MIKSMTGFGHAEKVTEQCRITVEMKSVNHRYLDLNIKMPRRFNMLEGQVRNLLKQYMQRGDGPNDRCDGDYGRKSQE